MARTLATSKVEDEGDSFVGGAQQEERRWESWREG